VDIQIAACFTTPERFKRWAYMVYQINPAEAILFVQAFNVNSTLKWAQRERDRIVEEIERQNEEKDENHAK